MYATPRRLLSKRGSCAKSRLVTCMPWWPPAQDSARRCEGACSVTAEAGGGSLTVEVEGEAEGGAWGMEAVGT